MASVGGELPLFAKDRVGGEAADIAISLLSVGLIGDSELLVDRRFIDGGCSSCCCDDAEEGAVVVVAVVVSSSAALLLVLNGECC